ncbi:hypothetical protein IWW39_003869 [Coemansia spiralis]|uniref:Membrane insertase YidC/Oxa/ALB C-terminal domain-containing protein n=1 Tax=Coemansia spiralis TaxID=417178 RepID=A0A9W8GIE4_9FUNG|nr:hypothetical protein IWW39_003869 [Coemansia spiralis]
MLCIAGRLASRRLAVQRAIPSVAALRRRLISTTPITSSLGEASDGGTESHLGRYADQLSSEAEYPLILRVVQATLESIHDGPMECPWWGIIVGSAFALRTLLVLPVAIYQQRAKARALKLNAISRLWRRPMLTSLELEVATRTPPVTEKELGKMLNKRLSKRRHLLMFRQGCHPLFGVLLPITQIPIWMAMTYSLRHLSGRLVPLFDSAAAALPTAAPGMASEGILWFTDLVVTDSTGVLPAITGAVYLANAMTLLYRRREYAIADSQDGFPPKEGWLSRIILCIRFAVPPIMTYVAMSQPSSIVLYWLTSASVTLAQRLAFHNQKLRKRLKFNYIKDKATEQ